MKDKTLDYYNQNAEAFVANTVSEHIGVWHSKKQINKINF